MRVVVTIAVLNEEASLGDVLARMPAGIDIVVVDDGSTDRSAEVARSYGARIVYHPMNMGQGVGVMTGFLAALMGDYDVIVEMDGDGQHDPAEIPKFLAKLEESDADFVVGSRILGANYENAPFLRRSMLPYVTWVINKLTGYNITDAMCGFRVFRADALRSVAHILTQMEEPQYIAAEMFIRFARAGLTVAEVPVRLKDRQAGVSRKGRYGLHDLFRYGVGVANALLRALFSN